MAFFKDLIKGERKSPSDGGGAAGGTGTGAGADLKSEKHQVVEGSAAVKDEEDAAGGDDESADLSDGETIGDEMSGAGTGGGAMDSAITVAPTITHSQFTTTSSIVMTSSMAPDESTKRRRHVSKIDAANEFVYGRAEEPWTKPSGRLSVDAAAGAAAAAAVRVNRAQTMRRSCIMKRVKEEDEERSRVEEQDVAWTGNEILDPIVARAVPKAVYGGPQIAIRETKCSKFRYLFNRKPPGVKVYFKPANEDERRKPPFVVAAVYH